MQISDLRFVNAEEDITVVAETTTTFKIIDGNGNVMDVDTSTETHAQETAYTIHEGENVYDAYFNTVKTVMYTVPVEEY